MITVFDSFWADLYWSGDGRMSHHVRTSKVKFSEASCDCVDMPWRIPDPFRYYPKPMNLMVSDAAKRRAYEQCKVRVWSKPIPHGSFVEVGNGFYVVSPEFLFLELARKLDFAQTVAVGYELCGTYSINPQTGRASFQIPPATTAAKLRRFAAGAQGSHGYKMASRAAQYVHDNSASPMETALHMHFSLPGVLGGSGLPESFLNYPVKLNEKAKSLYQWQTCYCDIYFPAIHKAIEYHGAFHRNQLDEDRNREVALDIMGIDTLPLTYGKYKDLRALGQVASSIAKSHGIYLKPSQVAPTKRRIALHASLDRYFTAQDRRDFVIDPEPWVSVN